MLMTFSKKNQIITGALVFFILVGSFGYFLYNDFLSSRTAEVPNNELVNVGGIFVTPEEAKHITVEQIPITSSIQVPDLTRPLVFSDSFPQAAREIVQKNVNTLIAGLKSDSATLNNWLDLGVQYKVAGDFTRAQEMWEYASLLSPLNFISFYNLGDLYHLYLKNFPLAEKNFLQAIENKPDYPNSYQGLYDLYRISYKEKSHLAPGILLKGIEATKNDINLLMLLGSHYKNENNKEGARTYYGRALEEAEKVKNETLAKAIKNELDSL